MADRNSNPSGGLGVVRFRVWPDKNTDSYSTSDLTNNWDKSDAIIGVPSQGTDWPPTEGIDGGIYREIKLLQADRGPIGEVIEWWRPTDAVPVPNGFAECNGQSLTSGDHDFPGGGTIILPDLRHKYVVGADANKISGTAAGVVDTSDIDTAAGAPGLGTILGSNQHSLSIGETPTHNHGGGTHDHGGGIHGHGVTDPGHGHTVVDPGHSHPLKRQFLNIRADASQAAYLLNKRDTETAAESTDLEITGIGIAAGKTYLSINSSGAIITSQSPVSNQGGGHPHENRPASVGLIRLMRVKYATTI